MPVEEGKFQLYTHILPPLKAGDWRLRASQKLTAQGESGSLNEDTLDIQTSDINFRVRSPRYIMPPDQILSTFPPANSFGSYGSRLPQVAIKRRTLPWDRGIDGQPESTPWIALVLIAEGEARLATGLDVAECITPGVTLSGVADVEKGNALVVRKSVIDKVFPTRNDVPLLAHAREVDISDTELLMGDDDGFISVVIANRLPLPGKDKDGEEIPIKYLACLINLEGQFDTLLEKSPDPVPLFITDFFLANSTYLASPAEDDHVVMGTAASPVRVNQNSLGFDAGVLGPAPLAPPQATGSTTFTAISGVAASWGATPNVAGSQWSASAQATVSSADVSLQMARDFRFVAEIDDRALDPEFRFPVLMHWSFTSTGDTTFRSLMEGLDSKLLGDVGDNASELDGRLPLEVVESGHVGLGHKTREGDEVRSWYRGPLVPHPTVSAGANRLPLAHSSDQLRIVIPDGREDLSLATAFEVGRLLTLSQPSIITSLTRWRQGHYHAARLNSLLDSNRPFWEDVLGSDFKLDDLYQLGPSAGRFFVDAIVQSPETFLGQPRPLVTPGRPLVTDGLPSDVLANGLGIDGSIFKGNIDAVFDKVRDVQIPDVGLQLDDIGTVNLREGLEATLDSQRIDLVSNTLRNQFNIAAIAGPAFPITGFVLDDFVVGGPVIPDVVDVILASSVDQASPSEDDELPNEGSE